MILGILLILGAIAAVITIYWWFSGRQFPDLMKKSPSVMPKLSLFTKVTRHGISNGPNGKSYGCKIIIGIRNNGHQSVKYPMLSVKVHPPYRISMYGLDGNYNTGLPKQIIGDSSSGFTQYGGNADIAIHPKNDYGVTAITFNIPASISQIKDVIIEAEISAEDVKPIKEKVIIKGSDIFEQIVEKAEK